MCAIRGRAGLGVLLLALSVRPLEAEETVFPMERVSISSSGRLSRSDWHLYFQGQYAPYTNAPRSEVKAYPKVRGERPLYGSIRLNSSYLDAGGTREFHFMFTESPRQDKPDELAKLLQEITDVISGNVRTNNLAQQYDLLYFDANQDLDLTNDPIVRVLKDPPEMLRAGPGQQAFQPIRIGLDGESPGSLSLVEVIPTLYMQNSSMGFVAFTPTVAYRGPIRLGNRKFDAVLSQSGTVTGRFDQRFTSLFLLEEGGASRPQYRWSSWLSMMRQVDGRLYEITATPGGEKLIVRTYDGPFGSLETDAAGQGDAARSGLSGVIFSKEHILTLGDQTKATETARPARHRVPVGDYAVLRMQYDRGQREVSLGPNPYLPGSLERRTEAKPVYAIRIREDRPFVFQFSEKPVVQFLRSGEESAIRPGRTASIQAILVLPQLNLMVSGLGDKSKKVGQYSLVSEGGELVTIPQYRPLQPTVAIQDSTGKTVAEGPMPFG